MGGTGSLVRGLVGLVRGQGGAVRCDAEVSEITVERPDGDGRAAGVGRAARGRRRGLERRFGLDLPPPAAARGRAAAGPTGGSTAPATRWASSSGTSARSGATPRSRTTRSCWGRATASCSHDIFERKVLADDFSLYLHRPTATDPSLAPPGCDAFYVLSPVPHLASGTTGARRPSPTAAPSREHLSRTLLPGPRAARSSPRALMTPARLPGPAAVAISGAAFGLEPLPHPERLVPAAQRERGRAAASTSSAPARTPAPACPACSPPPASSTAWCPHATALV